MHVDEQRPHPVLPGKAQGPAGDARQARRRAGQHGHLRVRDQVPVRPVAARRRRPEFEPRFRQGHHSPHRHAGQGGRAPFLALLRASRARRRTSTGATSARWTPIGRPTSTSPTSCPTSTSTTTTGRSGPMARSRRRRSSSMTRTAGAASAISSLVSGGCIVSGAAVSRSLLFTGVRVHSFSRIHEAVILPYVEIGRGVRLQQGRRRSRRASFPRGWWSARIPCRTPSASAAPTRGVCLITQPMIDAARNMTRTRGPLGRLGNLSAGQDRRARRRGRRAAGGAGARGRRVAHPAARLSRPCSPSSSAAEPAHALRGRCSAARRGCSRRGRRARPVRARRAASATPGPATPISAPTGATGRTTRSASPRSRASAPTSATARSPASRPTSCMPMTGRPRCRRPICTTTAAARPATVITIHNLAFQGHFPARLLGALGLPPQSLDDRRRRIFRRHRLSQSGPAASPTASPRSRRPTRARS